MAVALDKRFHYVENVTKRLKCDLKRRIGFDTIQCVPYVCFTVISDRSGNAEFVCNEHTFNYKNTQLLYYKVDLFVSLPVIPFIIITGFCRRRYFM